MKPLAIDGPEGMVIMSAGFDFKDLVSLMERLKSADLLVPGYVQPEQGLYVPEHYLLEQLLDKIEFWILPDRNLASRIAKLRLGTEVTSDNESAALLMAFAQVLNLNFDPSICFHELAASQGDEQASRELAAFRLADEHRPQEWLDLALGRISRLDVSDTAAYQILSLSKPFRRWRMNYVALLKVAELELQVELTPLQRALTLMHWMESDFIIAGPALLFAMFYFAPRFQKEGLLKRLRSPVRENALRGIQNATWDVTYLSEFVSRVNGNNDASRRYLIASKDKALRIIARTLIELGPAETMHERLSSILQRWWPKREASELTLEMSRLANVAATRVREGDAQKPVDFISGLIREGETKIQRWSA